MGVYMKIFIRFALFFSIFVLGLSEANPALGENENPASSGLLKFKEQTVLLEKSLAAEKKAIADLEARLELIKQNKLEFESKVNVHILQLSTWSSQLHLPDGEIKIIEKAFMSSQNALKSLTDDLTRLKQEREHFKQMQDKSYEQKLSNDNFLVEIVNVDIQPFTENPVPSEPSEENGLGENALESQNTIDFDQSVMSPFNKDSVKPEAVIEQMKNHLKALQTALAKKMLLIKSIGDILKDRILTLEDIKLKYEVLNNELETRVKEAKKADLLSRNINPLTHQTWQRVGEDIKEIYNIFLSITDAVKWKNNFSFLWLSGLPKLVSFMVVLLIVLMVALRSRTHIKKISISPIMEKKYWTGLVLDIFQKHLIFSFITAYFYLCINLKLFFTYSITANIIVQLLLILIFILWQMAFFKRLTKHFPFIPLDRLLRFLKILNLVAMIYIFLANTLKSDSSILIAYRLFWESVLYLWFFYFWKKFMPLIRQSEQVQNRIFLKTASFSGNGVMFVVLAGMVLELLGYGSLALYWYSSWAKTMMVIMWSGLIIAASEEWIPGTVIGGTDNQQEPGVSTFSMVWLIKQLCFIVLFFLSSIALFLSWGTMDFLFPKLYLTATYSFKIGSMSFSIASLIQAVIIIVITHFTARLWRHFFQKNFLGKSGLEQGLQESITTITVYSIWIFGIFIALIVFGLNSTTLTVAFGALGIGIGFGLQNIFNNFISGIILLFERPIQVGDDIEVNGTWATVKKTNVRSTIVQTYDNATIIIPNSEFISNQLVNWSFKDKRLRRKVVVGVEYGSDIELVRTSLLEIAASTPKVLKYPAPNVLFNDFGDSALIFTLRYWSFIDFFLDVETEIRFKIDKIFKERGLVIAFPQQDIHIRSMPPELLGKLQET